MLGQYQNFKVGLTSIGLDGEKIDQITYLPKPRIFVSKGMIVATAQDCLQECEVLYEILEETDVSTSLGSIVLIKILKEGNCLVGGPSTIQSMELIIAKLKKYGCEKILLDGAFSRTTLAQISDATIFCVGSSYSLQLMNIVMNAIHTVKLFQLPKYEGIHLFDEYKDIVFINQDNEIKEINLSTTLDCGAEVVAQITPDVRTIYIPKAVSASFLKAFIEKRHQLHCDIIVKSPVHLMVDDVLVRHLFQLKQKIYVLQPIHLVALTFNPSSPSGYSFSLESFRNQIQDQVSLPIYDVLEKSK